MGAVGARRPWTIEFGGAGALKRNRHKFRMGNDRRSWRSRLNAKVSSEEEERVILLGRDDFSCVIKGLAR